MNLLKRIFNLIAVLVCGNFIGYYIYDVVLNAKDIGIRDLLTLEYCVKIFKFPLAALALVFGIAVLEVLINGYKHSFLYRVFSGTMDKSTYEDLVYALLSLGSITRVIGLVLSLGIGFYLHDLIELHLGLELLKGSNIILQFIATCFLIPFFEYWHHRLMHTKYFWEIHKVHHSAQQFNGITTFRVHPIDSVLAGPFRALPAALLGIRPDVLAVYSLLNLIYQIWVHSELYLNFGQFQKYLFIDPSMHRIHHSSDPKYYDKNFGILAIYDRMFGTWQAAEGNPREVPIGFDDDGIHNEGRPVLSMFQTFMVWLRSLFRPTDNHTG